MQRVSSRMGYTIEQMYDSSGLVHMNQAPNNRVINYSLNTKYPMFFRVSMQGNRIELPIFAKECVSDRLIDLLGLPTQDIRKDIIIPFYIRRNDYPTTYRTADALVRNLVDYSSGTAGMYVCCETNKEEKYYGCNGTIFDRNMTPLFLNVIECDVNERGLAYRKVKSYVHPSVFYSEGTVEKCIVNKIIPYVMQNGVNVQIHNATDNINYNVVVSRRHRTIPEVVVTDIGDKFFCKTVVPSADYSNDAINDMLNRNIEDVFNIMKI